MPRCALLVPVLLLLLSPRPASSSTPSDCRVAIIGAGIGGVYTAWRLTVDTHTVLANQVCIFEAKRRPGGRIATVRSAVPAFERFTLDLGSYRFNRVTHPIMRALVEDVLQIPTACYTDPFNVNPDQCAAASRVIFTARGDVFGFGVDGSDSETAFENYTDAIPYNIAPQFQWNVASEQTAPRSTFSLLVGPSTVIPEMRRYPQLLAERDYSKAMQLADELIVTLRNGSYRDVSYRDLTLWQVAVAEGFTSEELRLFVDRSGPGSGLLLHSNVERLCQSILRSAALRKADVPGTPGLFVPVEERDGKLRRIGMGSIIERMLTQVRAKGVRLFYDSKLTGIDRVAAAEGSHSMRLSFLDGRSLTAEKVVLNIGKPDLLALGLSSEPLKSSSELFRRAVERVVSFPYAKTYCFWEDAWWVTKLNRTVGLVRTADQSMFSARYHDGDYVCTQKEGRQSCRGAMLVSYIAGDTTGGGSAITVRMHNDKPYTPLTNTDAIRVMLRANLSAHDALYFAELHRQLRRAHATAFAARGLDVQRELPDATACVVGDWSATGVHSERGAGRGEENVFEMYTRPVAGLELSLVNEGWAEVYGWAESSLRSAERALWHVFGLARPPWLDAVFHAAVIQRFNLG